MMQMEGVVQYELKLFFKYVLKNGYISMNTLSDRIQSFNYGHMHLYAIQSWCILRNTPIIFGDVVERDNNHWNLLLLLIQTVDIGEELLCHTLQSDPCSDVSTTCWVRNYGTEYQIDLLVCTGTSHDDLPVFKKICNIIIHEQHAFIIGCAVDTLYFDEHFPAYCIEEQNNEHIVIFIDQLMYFRPFDKQYSNESERTHIMPYCCMF